MESEWGGVPPRGQARAVLELELGNSHPAVWKENVLCVGIVLGAAGHTDTAHVLGLVPSEGCVA